jgi:hypothetical protein
MPRWNTSVSPRSVPAQPRHPRARQPLAQVGGERPAQIGAPRLDARQSLSFQHGAEAAHGGLDFGKLGHGPEIGAVR